MQPLGEFRAVAMRVEEKRAWRSRRAGAGMNSTGRENRSHVSAALVIVRTGAFDANNTGQREVLSDIRPLRATVAFSMLAQSNELAIALDITHLDLWGQISRYIETEEWNDCKVVYVLSRVRKLLEHMDHKNDAFPVLWFYCSWALHLNMYRPSAARVMEQFNRPETILDLEQSDASSTLSRFLSFADLRSALREFLISEHFSTRIVDSDDLWHQFLDGYCNLITGSLLTYVPKPKAGDLAYKYVRQIGIEYSRKEDPNEPFHVSWRIIRPDGKIYLRAYTYPQMTAEDERWYFTGE
jgi:hypothetical protein